ncbi:molybdopterin-guanine dinucleotide biosynthesis protein B [Bacillus siamensis]|uniref:Molybdopterin-guanine dinucleotide biosynthesis protein B n=1 Tax=Bacillus siamensis TaxID=659243 RepID=A0AAI8HPQ7_9BACI|nr:MULTISPECIES: molybdopterin-guanine dinucleotide biosynthesis protein B [Bacillus]AME05479.1 molybdopterin-guanine dinucleotide biosynthesis protein MobB [Bacillus sp. SDLI1]AUJ77900.1 molybdopterin-guanine dinucleotide biosynthesis protein B [Bacillus siamensis]UUA82524.1 molybdopterin-guanine dinucleotide biosynthesis protein B [Bacillus siamensis]
MAVVNSFPIVQIVGFQNSGKTTFIERILKAAPKECTVGCLKHHGHGGEPEPFSDGKDSERLSKAGAAVTAVEGDGVLQLTARKKWDLAGLIGLYEYVGIDCLLIEGFKHALHPKIIMIKSSEDWQKLKHLERVLAVVSRSTEHMPADAGIPVFHADDPDAIMFVLSQLKGGSA